MSETEKDLPIIRFSTDATEEEIAATLVLLAAADPESEPERNRRRAGWTSKRRTFNVGAVRGAGWGGSL